MRPRVIDPRRCRYCERNSAAQARGGEPAPRTCCLLVRSAANQAARNHCTRCYSDEKERRRPKRHTRASVASDPTAARCRGPRRRRNLDSRNHGGGFRRRGDDGRHDDGRHDDGRRDGHGSHHDYWRRNHLHYSHRRHEHRLRIKQAAVARRGRGRGRDGHRRDRSRSHVRSGDIGDDRHAGRGAGERLDLDARERNNVTMIAAG